MMKSKNQYQQIKINITKKAPDSFNAFLVEGANFTKSENYPIILKEMVPTSIPIKIISFPEAVNFKGNLKEYYICFYAKDDSFKRILKAPRRYISMLKRAAGIIGFDLSIHDNMPSNQQSSQIYNNLALTYFYGKQGIKVIPNV